MTRLPDESTILQFRYLLETHGLAAQMLALVNEILVEKGLMLKTGSVVDATLISAPSSTKNDSGTRDPEMCVGYWRVADAADVAKGQSGAAHTRHRRRIDAEF